MEDVLNSITIEILPELKFITDQQTVQNAIRYVYYKLLEKDYTLTHVVVLGVQNGSKPMWVGKAVRHCSKGHVDAIYISAFEHRHIILPDEWHDAMHRLVQGA